jgi:hypothetical protein
MATSRIKAVGSITESARSCTTCGSVNSVRSTSLGVTIFTCEHSTDMVIAALNSAEVASTTKSNGRWVCVDAATAQALAVR